MLQRISMILGLYLFATPAVSETKNLYDMYLSALEADPRLKISQYQLKKGQAQHDNAFGSLLPQANITANISENTVKYTNPVSEEEFDGKRYSLQIRQALFNWQALSGNARARELVAQREAELLDVTNSLLVDVSERYFAVLRAKNDLVLTQAEIDLVQQQLRQTQALFEKRLVKITDLLETQARADKVRTDLIEAENNAALAIETLSEITGSITDDVAPIKNNFTLPQLKYDMSYWTELAVSNNPLLKSKLNAVAVAREAIQEQKGAHYPTLYLVLSGQHSDVGYDNLSTPERESRYIGLDLTVPLYSGGSTSAKVREAKSHYFMAREEEEAVRRDILKRTREAWLNTVSSRKRIDSAALSVNSSNKSYEAMNKGFSYGTVTASDVLEALHRKTRAQRDYQDALYSYLTNWLTLRRESGSLVTADLQQLNEWMITSTPENF